ncbi:MAG: glycosyltransferase [Candidatus Hermodarchaeia archaeon]|jgi:glycosyltransferase involved in cell wall biosynthesis
MKATLLLATFNKNECLPNVLKSIARQETSFPLDICILDDASNKDPRPIVEEFLPDSKYQRAAKPFGTHHSIPECFKMADKDSDVIVTMSSDVVIAEPFGIEKLVLGAGPMKVAMAEVKNIGVNPNMHKNFEGGIQPYLKNWKRYGTFYCCGPKRMGFWLFFAALLREDWITAGFDKVVCDRINTLRGAGMKSKGFVGNCVHEVKAIHQKHGWTAHPCSFDECKYAASCPRRKLK